AHPLLSDLGQVDAEADEDSAAAPDLLIHVRLIGGRRLGLRRPDTHDRVRVALLQVSEELVRDPEAGQPEMGLLHDLRQRHRVGTEIGQPDHGQAPRRRRRWSGGYRVASWTSRATCTRLLRSSLVMIRVMNALTVAVLIRSSTPISLFVRPSLTSA